MKARTPPSISRDQKTLHKNKPKTCNFRLLKCTQMCVCDWGFAADHNAGELTAALPRPLSRLD